MAQWIKMLEHLYLRTWVWSLTQSWKERLESKTTPQHLPTYAPWYAHTCTQTHYKLPPPSSNEFYNLNRIWVLDIKMIFYIYLVHWYVCVCTWVHVRVCACSTSATSHVWISEDNPARLCTLLPCGLRVLNLAAHTFTSKLSFLL